MTFSIIWSEAAIQDLAAIWLHVSDRTALNKAANEIDRLLARDPQYQGESRPGNERVIYIGPLAIRFDVVVDDLLVTVGAVWLIRPL